MWRPLHSPAVCTRFIRGTEWSIKTFNTLSGVSIVFWISPQLDILCLSAAKRYCAKRQFTLYVAPVFPRTRVRGNKILPLVIFLLWNALQQKKGIAKISQTMIIWSNASVTMLDPINQDATKRRPGRAAEKSSDGALGQAYVVNAPNSWWPIDLVHHQRRLWILRKLCTIIECLHQLVFLV